MPKICFKIMSKLLGVYIGACLHLLYCSEAKKRGFGKEGNNKKGVFKVE